MRKRPPYLIRTVTRHGTIAWYVWKRPGPKIRIRGEYGSREFTAAYQQAVYDGRPSTAQAPDTDSFGALIQAYMASPQWRDLGTLTRQQRASLFKKIEAKSGDMPTAEIDTQMIKDTRDSLSPASAKHYLTAIRGLFRWAVETERLEHDPSSGVKLASTKSEGYHTWTEDEIAAYEARWPVGTRERLWLAILLYTGLRRGDACALGPRHLRGGVIEYVVEKTKTPVFLPMASELADIIAASPTGRETFIATVTGCPMHRNRFTAVFRGACDAAGVPGGPHGLRKAAATRLAEAGASVAELNAVLAWSGPKMAMLYTAKADRARLARQAVERLKK